MLLQHSMLVCLSTAMLAEEPKLCCSAGTAVDRQATSCHIEATCAQSELLTWMCQHNPSQKVTCLARSATPDASSFSATVHASLLLQMLRNAGTFDQVE